MRTFKIAYRVINQKEYKQSLINKWLLNLWLNEKRLKDRVLRIRKREDVRPFILS